MIDSSAARGRPLPLRQKIGYAAGGLVDGTALHPLNVFLLFYVTSVCGLPGGLAGAAIAAGLVVDAVLDPLIGTSSDRWRSRLGRRVPFMLAALLPIAASLTLIFSLPGGWSQTALFLWLTFLSVSLRTSVALFLLPHQALGAELSDSYTERSHIVALRWTFFIVGAIIGVLLGFGYFFSGQNGLSDRESYTPFALTLSVVVVLGGLIAVGTAFRTREREHAPTPARTSRLQVFADLGEVMRSQSFRILFIGAMLFFVGFGINSVLGLHVNTYFWRLTAGQTQSVTLSLFIGLFLGAPLAAPLLGRLEKRTVLLASIACLLFVQAAPVLLRLMGLFPFEGAVLANGLAVLGLVMGAMLGVAGIASASAIADAADEHELVFGSRREGLYYAGFAFANKSASALGTLVAGFVLQIVDFPAGPLSHGGGSPIMDLPREMTDLLALTYGPGAALLSLAALLTNRFYRIDRNRHREIIAALKQRRTHKASPPEEMQ